MVLATRCAGGDSTKNPRSSRRVNTPEAVALMKRPPHSFVVEVRKQRRPPGEPAKSWFEEPPPAAPTPASLAAFAEPAAAPIDTAPARPAGRILPSLVEPPPASDVSAPPAVKPRKAKAAEKKLPAYKKLPGYKKRLAKMQEPPRAPAPPPVHVAPQLASAVASDSRQPSRAERHSRILKRYVYGGEPKAGERWKRRLQRSDR
jgi:hypothetical protein